MALTTEELAAYVIDPNMSQLYSYKTLTEFLDGTKTVPDATNPFSYLSETSSQLTAAALHSVASSARNIYPDLASNKEELYNHLNTTEIDNIFSAPSSCLFNLYIGKKELLRFGETLTTHTLLTIPKYSFIKVNEITFTIVNDVSVYLYNDGRVFAKSNFDTSGIAEQTDEVISSRITTDSSGKVWIHLELNLKQLTRYDFKETILSTEAFDTTFALGDGEMFTYLEANTINKTSGGIINVDTTFSNFVYNPNIPTIIVKPLDSSVLLKLPITYTVSGLASTYLDFKLYTTKGLIEIPMGDYETSEFEFTAVIPESTPVSTIGINNIPVIVNSSDYTTGGRNELSFLDLKSKIINYATGDNNLPITIQEIADRVSTLGFTYRGIDNHILKSDVLVSKNIGNLDFDVFSNIDTIQTTIKLDLSSVTSDKILHTADHLILEPYQLYKVVGTSVVPLSNSEKDAVTLNASNDILAYNESKIFFNLYKYIFDYENVLTTRVYDTNQPAIDNSNSIFTGTGLSTPVVISDRKIINKGNLYVITITIESNTEIDKIDTDYLFGQLVLSNNENDNIAYTGTAEYTPDGTVITVEVPTDPYINNEHMILGINGISDIEKLYINLLTTATFYLYSTDKNIAALNTRDTSVIAVDDVTLILYEETFEIEFGLYLDNLYTHYDIEYTSRKFVTRTENLEARYDKTVYATDDDGTISLTYIDTDDDGVDDDVNLTVLHEKGDLILDDEGNPTYVYKIGDLVIDEETMLPIVDPLVGVVHTISLLLLEDVFLRATNDNYYIYRLVYFKYLTDLINKDLEPLADELLDGTSVKFISDMNVKDVTIKTNKVIYSYPSLISPVIECYVSETGFMISDSTLKTVYGYLQEQLLLNISLGEIEYGIKSLIPGEVLVIKLTNIVPNNDVSILNYTEDSSKFMIKKILVNNEDQTTAVKPDLTINVITIQGT